MSKQTVRRSHPRVGEGSVTVLQLTDTHLYADPNTSIYGINSDRSLGQVIAAAGQGFPHADLALLTGDLVHDASEAGYRRLASHAQALGVPAYLLPGNHDQPATMEHLFLAGSPRWESELVLGAWQLMLLNSHVPGQDYGEIGETQLRFLDERLGASRALHTLVCLHHQPVAIGCEWMDAIGLRDAPGLWEILDRHKKVRGLLWGHVHQEYLGERAGILLMGSPSTCVQFKPSSSRFALDSRPPAYRWLRLGADGTIDTGVVWVEMTAEVGATGDSDLR